MAEEKPVITPGEARALITADKLERERNAAANINKALLDANCELHTVIEYASSGRIVSVGYKTVAVTNVP